MTLNPARDTEVVAGRRRNRGSAGPRGRMPAPGSGRLQRGALGGRQSRGRRAAGEAATGRGRRPLRPRGVGAGCGTDPALQPPGKGWAAGRQPGLPQPVGQGYGSGPLGVRSVGGLLLEKPTLNPPDSMPS